MAGREVGRKGREVIELSFFVECHAAVRLVMIVW